MIKSVYLSPSTQENNIGAGSYGTEEFRMNQIADIVQRHLLRHNIIVYRNKPVFTLRQVVEDSNLRKPNIHFAIHSNAFKGVNRGCEIYCHRFGYEGEKLARAVYAQLEPLTPTTDRGVKEGANFFGPGRPLFELSETNAPAALVEIAFHDQPEDAKWILSNYGPISVAISKGILSYFGVAWMDEKNQEIYSAIEILSKKGLIEFPQYWKENSVNGRVVNGEYVGTLLKKVAAICTASYASRPGSTGSETTTKQNG